MEGELMLAPEMETVSLCSLTAGGKMFGIDTRSICEVLGNRVLQAVPLAMGYIGGVVPYRGEVLMAVSLCALLGTTPAARESCVLVLDGGEGEERFGLMVDSVGGVLTVQAGAYAVNPSTLDAQSKALFEGAYRMSSGLLVQLCPERLRPARLAACGLFADAVTGMKERLCAL